MDHPQEAFSNDVATETASSPNISLTLPSPNTDPHAVPFTRIAHAYCSDLAERSSPMSRKDRDRAAKMLARFVEWAGEVSVAECDWKLIARYAKELQELPSRATQIEGRHDATLPEMIAYGRMNPAQERIEPLRVLRRLQLSRGWSDDEHIEQQAEAASAIPCRGPRAGDPDGPRE